MIALSSFGCNLKLLRCDLSLNFKRTIPHCSAVASHAISKAHRQNFIKSFSQLFCFLHTKQSPHKAKKTVHYAILAVFWPKLLILHFVNVITKLNCSAQSGAHTAALFIRLPYRCGKTVCIPQNRRKTAASFVRTELFTILLCILREDGL